MIRFCDREVACVEYESLDREELVTYFFAGHIDDIVVVYDSFTTMRYIGRITFQSLVDANNKDSAIQTEYVILNQYIWKNTREYFDKRRETDLTIPVLDEEYHLVCFAYMDDEANREIRQLRELLEVPEALQFSDIYPEYKCVRIHEFNELAYFFAKYLESQNIAVQVEGRMWQGFFDGEECCAPNYECLNIYAEGTWEKPRNWKKNLLRSVSVEFGCIDKIYEENIKNNLIRNTVEGGYNGLLDRLRGENEVIIYGIDMKAQDTYDFLLGIGIEACCFVVDELDVGCMHRLFGKKIMSLHEAICAYRNPVFIECTSKYSAWGLGRVDYFDYIGYKRNKRFIVLRDYIEVPSNNLLNVLKNTEVVLTGDCYLCSRLYEYFMRKQVTVIGYLHTLPGNIQIGNMPEVLSDDIKEDTLCIIAEPVYYSYAKCGLVGEKEINQRTIYLRQKNLDNYVDYFCDIVPFINVEKDNDVKYGKKYLKPKKIVLGSIAAYNGNVFFRSLLDSHPQILCMGYCDLNNLLFWICVRLSMESAENILPLFWELIRGNEQRIIDKTAFDEKMRQLLAGDSRFTSQELCVMFHIAYMYMFRRDIAEVNISDMIIYWEPHHLERDKLEECVGWLGTKEMPCDIINVVRNSLMQSGSSLKTSGHIAGGVRNAYYAALRCTPIEQKRYEQSDRIIVKFEDLKCKPRETLKGICDSWNIVWSDMLMRTTKGGQEHSYTDKMHTVSGFDLSPVYNTYENFFSELDRLKMMLINAAWQKKYGYPYVDPDWFARRELQEMFLKEFRFENPGDTTGFYKNRLELDDRIELQDNLRRKIQKIRCLLWVEESSSK